MAQTTRTKTCPGCSAEFTYAVSRGTDRLWCSTQCSSAAVRAKISERRQTFPPCTADGCANRARSAGARHCEKHYGRLRRSGTLDANTPRPERGWCIVPDCGQRDCGPHGYCDTHNTRVKRHGDPHVVLKAPPTPLAAHPCWVGDAAGYGAVHWRLKVERGPASNYPCTDCGNRAKHWSYDHGDPDERSCNSGPFSIHPDYYSPRCVPCHKSYDLNHLSAQRVV